MILKEILEGFSCPKNLEQIDIKSIKIDSSQVEKGDLFIALKGGNFDGNDFVRGAFKRGAVAAISDEIEGENIIKVENARRAYAIMSKNFFGSACDEMKIVAVTGTNGKTTTTRVTADILNFNGIITGVIGTLGASYRGKTIDLGMTTPDPFALHKTFLDMKNSGVQVVVMEASAHALTLDKLEGIAFKIGVLTNITEDHLDFFGDMDTYAKAKLKLFDGRAKIGLYCTGKAYIDKVRNLENMQSYEKV